MDAAVDTVSVDEMQGEYSHAKEISQPALYGGDVVRGCRRCMKMIGGDRKEKKS